MSNYREIMQFFLDIVSVICSIGLVDGAALIFGWLEYLHNKSESIHSVSSEITILDYL